MRFDGLDAAALERLTGAPRVDLRDATPSTQDLAHALGASGAPSGSFALADEQTAGRGRAGRAWHSAPGAGIWLSVLLRPAHAPPGGALAIRAALAVHSALAAAAPAFRADLKWPNDICAMGRKLGGILCEARWMGEQLGWAVVGIGLNVHGPLDPVLEGQAATVAAFDASATRLGLLEALVPRVAALAGNAGPLGETEIAAYLERLRMPAGAEPVVGLAPDGALLVRGEDGVVRRTEAS